jgi:aspartyl aminopeptidase
MTGPVDLLADLLAFIDASPTPFHVVAAAGERLRAAGFAPIAWTDELRGLSPGRY